MKNNNVRIEALYKLGIWVIFLIIMFSFVFITNNFNKKEELNTDSKETIEEDDFTKLLERLENEHYFLKANINKEEKVSYFVGEKIDKGLEGYWQEDEIVTKCQIIDNKCLEYDAFYLEVNNILDLFKNDTSKALVTEKDKIVIYDFTDLNGLNVVIEAENNYIKNLKIENNLVNYEINFYYVVS